MADRYIAPSTIWPATDSRKPNAFEKVQMWWADWSSTRSKVVWTDWTVFAKSSYSDEDYLTDMQKSSSKAIDDINKAQAKTEKEKQERARLLYIEDQKKKTQEMNAIISNPNKTETDIERLKDLNASVSVGWNDLDSNLKTWYIQWASTQTVSPTIAQQPGVPAPVRGTEQPWATPTPWQQANGGGGFVPPPEKNKPNQYTFADGHKEYDSTAIPSVLNNGKITPARYFAMNGMNFIRDAKKLATEMGMTNYRGTPGENYALVNFMEEKKNGNPTAGGENRGSNRKFDGIQSDVLPNRFTQEDRDRVMAMTPEEQAKYVSERNVADLKKMLPDNIGLINKVFGTNYTSDDLTGGIGRATIMGTGMTAKGMEVQKLIEGLNEATANKFMSQWGELDNAVVDNAIMGTSSPQSGRRKILEDMVDGRIPMGQGTTIDSSDTKYMQDYKLHKRVLSNAETYNKMITAWNNMDPNNITRNKLLVDIQQKVNDIKKNDPEVYAELQKDLDRIPEFISKWGIGKIPTATVTSPWEKAEKVVASENKKIKIAPASNNNIPDATDGVYTKDNAELANIDPNNLDPIERQKYFAKKKWVTITNEEAQKLVNQEVASQWSWEAKVETQANPITQKQTYSGYTPQKNETRIGYSSNSISQW